ncbi:hydrolase [Suttonella sp. R2A3]|uniref:hydrolase n=1 Tax=Suttonella sp. R2A3 TaxID=2908648 RepID=UPI001F190AC0|nr:hydrolase [Suttonella sp. R2A3]UJF24255.1 hydrolase [Suttonella sp. R2A3]
MSERLSARYAETLSWIDDQQQSLVATLIEWANINSGSYHHAGVDAYREVMRAAFSELLDEQDSIEQVNLKPFNVVNQHGEEVPQTVADGLIIRKRPEAKKRIFLCGHLDTVFPKDHSFQRCQIQNDNRLNGPGVADMKGGILVMLTALKALERETCAADIGWDVYLSPDEEIGSQSSAPIFERFKDNAFGMIYEPSLPGGEFVGERKGSGNFSVVVRGQAAHAGRAFYDGRNAIAKLSAIISDLTALNDPNHPTTLNIATIEGGSALNVVPDLAIMRFNIRVASDEDAQAILRAVDEVIANHQAEGFEISRHGNLTRPAKPMDNTQKALFAALERVNNELGLPTEIIATGGCCDGNNLKALGMANIDTLGVRGGNIHSADEFVLLDSLSERAKLSALMLLGFASGDIILE